MNILNSALFVDFDNIYIRLQEQDTELAEQFARRPGKWLDWLERQTVRHRGQDFGREVLFRRCYLNPRAFYDFRYHFITSAFHVVDCPPLTSTGKTSADVYMLIDMLDMLPRTDPRYDEFIIFSGDTDFTPALTRLREHARVTTVFSVGAISKVYRSSATVFISEGQFIDEALSYDEPAEGIFLPGNGGNVARAEARDKVARYVRDKVAASPRPLSMAELAESIRRAFPETQNDWYGEARFSDFLMSLDLGDLRTSFVTPGYLYDPARHDKPSPKWRDHFPPEDPELEAFARKVNEATDTPLLSPASYRVMFQELADDVEANGYHMTTTSKNLRDRCVAQGINVGRQQVNFLLIGIGKGGLRIGEQQGASALELARPFAKNVWQLCEAAGLEMGKKQSDLLFHWLLPREQGEA